MQRQIISATMLLLLLQGSVWGQFDPLTGPDLLGWWAFEEGEGTIAFDSSPNANDGAIEGDATWVPGVYGTALNFNGTDAYVSTGESLMNNLADFTMAGWVMARNASGSRIGLYGQNDLVEMGFMGGNAEVWTAASGTTNTAWNFPETEWHHLAVVDQDTDLLIYIDGQVAATGAGAASHGTSAYAFNIGGQIWDATGNFFDGQIDDVALFARALTEAEIQIVMEGIGAPELASAPNPADEATDVPRNVVLNWTTGEFAATHDIYFGTAFEDVNQASRGNPMGVLVSEGQTADSYDPEGTLDFETTYYWRVDEVNAAPDETIFRGDVWSFTTEPFAYAVADVNATTNGISVEGAGLENIVNGSGLNAEDQHSVDAADMWLASAPEGESLWIQFDLGQVYKLHQMLVWNYNVQFEILLGFGIRDVTVEYSEDGTDWTTLGDFELAQATATPEYVYNTTIDFGGAPARYVRLTVNSGWGGSGQFGLSEVRFTYIPAQAREPEPADGATNVDPDVTLTWRAGREADMHEVYLGTDPNAPPLVDTVDTPSYAPTDLLFGETYYWKVVEVNEADEVSAWPGPVWSFMVRQYARIDDFESYTDDIDAGEAIFDTWLDGYVNETGSIVGYIEAPFTENAIVHSGGQSMPLHYNNDAAPFYSETQRTFETPQDWTGHGADTLVLYVRGNAPDFLETDDGTIVMNAIGTDIWNNADEFRFAYQSLSGNGSITARVDSVYNSDPWAKAGVMIRETLEAGSTHAMVVVTPQNGVSFQRRVETDGASSNTDAPGLTAPHWVRLTRTGDTFTAEQSSDGETWTSIEATPAVTIPMTEDVYIGLALTSHNANVETGAAFSDISTSGTVTGSWQTEDIGVAQPDIGNSAEPLYVGVSDASGSIAVVTNPDPAITVRPTWQEWQIPYSELAGVDLSQVETMYIGVGDRDNPTEGGSGLIFIDDIGYGRGNLEEEPPEEPAEP